MRRTKEQIKREGVAYHEAGHVVMAWILGIEVDCAEIYNEPWEQAMGQVWYASYDDEHDPDHVVLRLLAGMEAECIKERTSSLMALANGGMGDYRKAETLCREQLDMDQNATTEFLDRTGPRIVRKALKEYWPVVQAVAAALLETGGLEYPELEIIRAEHMSIKKSPV